MNYCFLHQKIIPPYSCGSSLVHFSYNSYVCIYIKCVSGLSDLDERLFGRVNNGKVVLLSPIFDSRLLYVFDS